MPRAPRFATATTKAETKDISLGMPPTQFGYGMGYRRWEERRAQETQLQFPEMPKIRYSAEGNRITSPSELQKMVEAWRASAYNWLYKTYADVAPSEQPSRYYRTSYAPEVKEYRRENPDRAEEFESLKTDIDMAVFHLTRGEPVVEELANRIFETVGQATLAPFYGTDFRMMQENYEDVPTWQKLVAENAWFIPFVVKDLFQIGQSITRKIGLSNFIKGDWLNTEWGARFQAAGMEQSQLSKDLARIAWETEKGIAPAESAAWELTKAFEGAVGRGGKEAYVANQLFDWLNSKQLSAAMVPEAGAAAPTILSKATQTGAMAYGGKAADAGALTKALWDSTPTAQRVLNAKSVGLSETVGSKSWDALTTEERTALQAVDTNAPAVEAPKVLTPKTTPEKAAVEPVAEPEVLAKPPETEATPIVTEKITSVTPEVAATETPVEQKAKLVASIQEEAPKYGYYTPSGKPSANFKRLVREYTGGRANLNSMSPEDLTSLLARIQTTRPDKIGNKRIITKSTEDSIVALKDTFTLNEQISDLGYQRLLNQQGLLTDKWESPESFITEREGRGLLRELNRQAQIGLLEWDAQTQNALETQPRVKAFIDKLDERIATEGATKWGKQLVNPSVFWDMTRYYQELQKATGGRFYEVFNKITRAANLNDWRAVEADRKLESATPNFKKITRDNAALERVQKIVRGEAPQASYDEIALATAIKRELDSFKNDVRFHRIREGIQKYDTDVDEIYKNIFGGKDEKFEELGLGGLPPKADIAEAIRLWETGGDKAMRAFLDTKTWGVIETGYDPRIIASHEIELREINNTRVNKSALYDRSVEEIPKMDKNIIQRLHTYRRRMYNLELEPYFEEMEKMFKETQGSMRNPKRVQKTIEDNLRVVRGYFPRGVTEEWARKLLGWSFSVVALSPRLSVRNLHQNIAFNPDFLEIANPNASKLTDTEQLFSDIFVHQFAAVIREWLLQESLPYNFVGNFLRKVSYYGKSDKINRDINMFVAKNKAGRALNRYQKDGDFSKFAAHSGLSDFQPLEQKYIAQLFSLPTVNFGAPLPEMSGQQAAVLEIGRLETETNQFRYKRRERAPIEQEPGTGAVIWNLTTFPRSFGQKTYNVAAKLAPNSRASGAEKRRATKVLVSATAGILAANALYAIITGKDHAPYDPREMMDVSLGGLATGYVQEMIDAAMNIFRVATGDTDAWNELATGLPRVAGLTVPLYSEVIDIVEAILEKQNIDREAIRKVKAWFVANYKPSESAYEAERTLIEALQHIFFGTRLAEQQEGKTIGTKGEAEESQPKVSPTPRAPRIR